MPPLVHLQIDFDRFGPLRHLRDYNFRAALVEFVDDPVGIVGLVAKQRTHFDALDQRCNAQRVPAVTGQQYKANKVAQCIGESDDLGRPTALGLAYSLALSPPFAPWPCR